MKENRGMPWLVCLGYEMDMFEIFAKKLKTGAFFTDIVA